MRADFDNPQTRDAVMEYFVDKVYLYDDKLVATFFYSEDRTEISWGELGDLVIDPFVKGEAAEFDVFPFGSTIMRRYELFFIVRNVFALTIKIEDC